MHRLLKEENGVILPIVVILTLILMITGLVFISLGVQENRLVRREIKKRQAFYLAEAGIERARVQVGQDWDDDTSIDATSLATGTYSVSISKSSSERKITSIGTVGELSKTVEVTLERTITAMVFNMSVFAGAGEERGFTVGEDVTIDSYDSEGTGQDYPNGKGSNGHIGTNSTDIVDEAVEIKKNSYIDGNVYVGAGGDPDEAIKLGTNVTISGSKMALDENRELSQVDSPSIPPGLSYQGELVVEKDADDYVHESGHYSSISVEQNGHLTFDTNATFIYVEGDMSIEGNVDISINTDMTLYVAGNFTAKKNLKLNMQDDYKLTMYAGGNITVAKDSLLNNVSKNPLSLVIYGLDTCTEVVIGKNTYFSGAVYSRNALIDIGDVDIYGSVVGDTIEIGNNASIHYDEALADISVPGAPGGDSLNCKNWKEL